MTETPAPPAHAPAVAQPEPEVAAADEQPAKPERPRVQLFDRMDGTWYRPAPFSKAAACIEFWNTAQIPDGAIEQFEKAYRAAVEGDKTREHNAVMNPWGEAWMAANPKPKRDKDRPEWQTRFDADFKERKDALDAELAPKYPSITFYDLPQLLRVARMLQTRPSGVYWEQGNLVFQEWIELYEETLTVQQIEEKYHLSRIWNALFYPAVPSAFANVVAALEDVAGRIDGMHNELNSARGTLLDIERALE